MKGKGSGLEAIKKLALQHGEKAAMVLVVALAGWLLYGTINHEGLPESKSPQKLEDAAGRLNRAVADYTWEQATTKATGQIRVHEDIQSDGDVEINPQPYYDPTSAGLDQAIVPQIELRRDPTLLAVTDFEGHAATGLFAFIDEERRKELIIDAMKREKERELEREKERERMEKEANSGRRPGRGRNRGGMGEMGFDQGMMEGGFGAGFGPAGDLAELRPVPFPLPRSGVELSGEELIRQLSCAVVMAKVPLPEQLTEFKKALANTKTYRPDRDFPQYKGYFIERAEVTSDGQLDWKPVRFPNGRFNGRNSQYLTGVSFKNIDQVVANWSGGLEELYDPRYGHPALTMPMAPLVGRNWDTMAYHTGVPTALETEAKMMEEARRLEEGPGADEEGEGRDMDIFGGGEDGMGGEFAGDFGGPGRGMRDPYAMEGMGMGMGMGRGMGGEGMMGMGGEGMMGMGMGMGGGMSPMLAGNQMQFNEAGELVVEVPFLMLRFFDLTVKPGKSYKYRVKLALADPNYGQSRDVLDPAVAARKRGTVLMGEWSEPSPTITVPQAGRVRIAASDTPRDSATFEPKASMVVEAYDVDIKKNARQAAQEIKDVRRGSVLNYHGTVTLLVQQNRFLKEVEDFTIDTGTLVLDMDGGDTLTKEMKEPTHALLMDSTGRMYLRDELDDEMEVAIHKAIFAKPDKRKKTDQGRDDEYGYGFEGGFDF